MLNRSCRYLIWVSRRRTATIIPRTVRSYCTSSDGDNGSGDGTTGRHDFSMKLINEIKEESGATDSEKAVNENLAPQDIRKRIMELKHRRKWKGPKPSEVASKEVLTAIDVVARDFHHEDMDAQRKTKNELTEKLIEYEKEKFEAATSAQYSEMLSDKAFANFLASLKEETARPTPRAIEMRRMRQGLLLLKREIFYQAMQSGHKAEDARGIAERAVKIAEQRAIKKHEILTENYTEEQKKKMLDETEQTDKENTFYAVALQLASKMLYPDSQSFDGRDITPSDVVHPDVRVKNIFENTNDRLGIFKSEHIPKLKDHSIKQWVEWDMNAAKIWNQSFGPSNAFEEMIELTEQGKMWPYPIDNEYQIGEEEDVAFYEHIFLDKYLAQYNLPEEGSVAQFMELVCIGLSKNPYMSLKKKHAHIDWFVKYFKEKAEEIKRIQQTAGLAVESSI